MSSPIGLIRNRRATRAGVGRAPGSALLRQPESLAALDAALAEFREAGVAAIVIEGGDGTVREVLSRAFPLWEGAPPPFGVVAAGNTNLVARSAGRLPPEALGRDPSGLRRRALPVLEAARAGRDTLCGFVLGAGAYAAATRWAQEEAGARHGLQVALAVARLLRGPTLRGPFALGFDPEGGVPVPAPRTLVAATSLPGALIWGLSPFWGGGAGPLRWLDVAAEPPRLALAAAFAATGRPRRWMAPHWRSGRTAVAALAPGAEFVMDGEAFPPGEDGLVRLSARRSATFLSA